MTAVTNEFRTESSVGTERLRELLEPRSIVIIGANSKSTWSHFAHSNLLAAGFTGELYLVNRRAEECHGQASYSSIAELPEAPELAIVLTGTNSLPQIQEQCIAKGIRNLIVLASGLGEAGEEGQALQQQLVDRAREADQLILGPNNLGFINFHSKVAAFAHMTQLPLVAGGVGIASQSGALTIYLLPYMASRGVGASLCVTVGNEAMISAIDVMSLLVEDEDTKVIAAYLEQVTDTAQFLDVARRAREAGKPIVVFKAGASEASAKAAAAHTGSLAGDDKIFDAVCRQFGVIRVANIEDLVATAGILESYGALPGPRFGVVTASGAMCALVADKAEASGLQLPSPAEATVRQLREDGLPEFAAVNNPMDTTGYISVDPSILTKAGDAFINDENFDFVVLNTSWPTNQFMADLGKPTQEGLHRQLTASAKPVVAMSFLPTEVNEFARNFAAEHSLPHASDSFDRGIEAAGHSVWWGQRTAQLAAEPQLGAPARIAKPEGAEGWTEIETGDFLREHGVPYVPGRVVASAAQAVATAQEIGYPVVLKVASEDIAHKTEVGGVRLMLKDAAEVSEAHEFIVDSVAKLAPEARGVLVEILKDSALRLLPVSPQEIRRMLDSLRGIDLLTGFRGSEATDLDELAQVIFQITQVALGLGEDLEELEINPLRVAGNQIEALDALIRWKDR